VLHRTDTLQEYVSAGGTIVLFEDVGSLDAFCESGSSWFSDLSLGDGENISDAGKYFVLRSSTLGTAGLGTSPRSAIASALGPNRGIDSNHADYILDLETKRAPLRTWLKTELDAAGVAGGAFASSLNDPSIHTYEYVDAAGKPIYHLLNYKGTTTTAPYLSGSSAGNTNYSTDVPIFEPVSVDLNDLEIPIPAGVDTLNVAIMGGSPVSQTLTSSPAVVTLTLNEWAIISFECANLSGC
jgi:hypothetical protein